MKFSPVRMMKDQYGGLPNSIYVLFVARIINRFGGFVHPFLVLFLGEHLGMSESTIGTYMLVAGGAGFVGSACGGKLGDHFSRKKIYLIAQSIAAILFVPCAFLVSGNMALIPYFLIASSFFSSIIRPVSTAMVTDIVSKEDRKRAYSLLYLGINVGVAIGPVVGAFLYQNYLVWFFLLDAFTTMIAVVLVGMFVEEHRLTEEEMNAIDDEDDEAREELHLFHAFLKRPRLILFVTFSVITGMIYSQVSFAFPMVLQERFSDGVTFYAHVTMFNAVVVLVFTGLVHYLTRHLRPIYNIAIASFLYAIGMGMMNVIDTKWLFVISVFIWTIGEIQAVTNQNVYLMNHTPINYRSRFLAVINIITSAGYITSPKIGGMILEHYGEKGQFMLWSIVGIGGVIAGIAFVILGLSESKKVGEIKG